MQTHCIGAAQRLEISNKTSLLVNKEIKKLLDEAYAKALRILGQDCVAADTCIHSKLKK